MALSSGTAALHLALLLVGVVAGDEVLVPSFTFIATAAAITYLGAHPFFVDCSADSWNLDPALVEEVLKKRARSEGGRPPWSAVDLYGETADYPALESLCRRFEMPLIEDSAEALGATYRGRAAGSFGVAGVFSFNGNKIITTSGGGMLVTESSNWPNEPAIWRRRPGSRSPTTSTSRWDTTIDFPTSWPRSDGHSSAGSTATWSVGSGSMRLTQRDSSALHGISFMPRTKVAPQTIG